MKNHYIYTKKGSGFLKKGKAVIIGAGGVGSSIAYTLMLRGMYSEMVIIDINRKRAEGEALDMMHGVSFTDYCRIYAGDYSDCKGAEAIVITAGAAQEKGEGRRELLGRNAKIIKSIVSEVVKYITAKTFMIVVTNPVDVLSYYAYKISALPKNRVIGSGTVLDTSHLKYALSKHTGIDPDNIGAYILGEHGDSEMAAWSKTTIAGMEIPDFCRVFGKCQSKRLGAILNEVKNSAYDVIEKKGSTHYAVALAVCEILSAIDRNSNSILTVSTLLEGQYGIKDIYLSLPAVVNGRGADKILQLPLSKEEEAELCQSAKAMKKLCGEIGI